MRRSNSSSANLPKAPYAKRRRESFRASEYRNEVYSWLANFYSRNTAVFDKEIGLITRVNLADIR